MARTKPWIRDHRMAVLVGLALFALGALALRDAYEGHGKPTPRILRPITFW